jgi:predicted HTH domain antitoxin
MSIQIDLPDSLDLTEFELKMHLAARLFDKGVITSGQGAEIAGVSKQTFIELLGRYEVSVFQYGIDEIMEDFENA